jgi:hypothetical protein
MIPVSWLATIGHFLAVNAHEVGRCWTWASNHPIPGSSFHKSCTVANGYRW